MTTVTHERDYCWDGCSGCSWCHLAFITSIVLHVQGRRFVLLIVGHMDLLCGATTCHTEHIWQLLMNTDNTEGQRICYQRRVKITTYYWCWWDLKLNAHRDNIKSNARLFWYWLQIRKIWPFSYCASSRARQTSKWLCSGSVIWCVPHFNHVYLTQAAKFHSKQMSALALLWKLNCKNSLKSSIFPKGNIVANTEIPLEDLI